MKPKVTIGVCVRNTASTIRGVIESIYAQDYPHELIEVIFVDDGSVDKTLSIIKEYAAKLDMKVKIFHHEWRGLGVSRNIVVNGASGKYIIWIDGDMFIPKDHIKKQVEFMEKHPNVAVGKARCALYDTNNIVAYLENISAMIEFTNEGSRATYKLLGAGGAIYRSIAIKSVGGFNEEIKGSCEDIDAEFRMRGAHWKLCITPAIFYERRRETWKSLWDEYFWHGIGGHFIKNAIKSTSYTRIKFFPPTAVLILVSHSIRAYKIFHKKKVFFLPFHWIFKRIAWLCGFLTGDLRIKNLKAR